MKRNRINMNLKPVQKKERLFSLDVLNDFEEVIMALQAIDSDNVPHTEATLLVPSKSSMEVVQQKMEQIRSSSKYIWDARTPSGFFKNPKVGRVFVYGVLSEVFLFDIDGIKLAELSEGPYGILRGLGMNESQATFYIKALANGKLLLLIR